MLGSDPLETVVASALPSAALGRKEANSRIEHTSDCSHSEIIHKRFLVIFGKRLGDHHQVISLGVCWKRALAYLTNNTSIIVVIDCYADIP